MQHIKKMLSLSKKIALGLLNDTNEEDIKHILRKEFTEQDAKTIFDNLSDKELLKQRETQKQLINTSKHLDWEKVRPKEKAKKQNQFKSLYKYAAILVLALCSSYLLWHYSTTNTETIVGLPHEDIMLNLPDGTSTIISQNSPNTLDEIKASSKGFMLDYTKQKNNVFAAKQVYNEITVPNGRNFKIILSDGSKVTLNAGSSLKYPTSFSTYEKRQVYLKGEAYFEVTKHPENQFVVTTEDLNVTVYGTSFNVTSYPEDAKTTTVLVEGSVAISPLGDASPNKSIYLEPGQRALYAKTSKTIDLKSVKTALYTSWLKGKIVFEHMPFSGIIKKLERHYDVTIINNNKALDSEKFTASFDDESIEQVLNSFKTNFNFNYTIKNNTITLN